MIVNGTRVEYSGTASVRYFIVKTRNLPPEPKKGKVITDPYQLPTVNGITYVDVLWDGEGPKEKDFLNEQRGHVVNIENLKEI